MPVSLTWDTQDAIPEGLKDHAVEKDGKFVFEAETLKEVENLKSTTKKERDARVKFEKEAKRVERFKPLLDSLNEADDEELTKFLEGWGKRSESKPDPDATQKLEMEKKLWDKEQKKLANELGLIRTELEKAQRELKEFRLWTPLRETAIKSGLIPEDWELARLDLANKNQFGFDDDGKIVVLEDGHPSSVSPEKFFKEVYSDQRQKFYKATAAGGSGAQSGKANGSSGKKTMPRADWEKLPPAEQSAFFRDGATLTD